MSRIPTLCLAAAVAVALVGAGTAAAATGSPSTTAATTTTPTTTQSGGAASTQTVTPPPTPGHVQSVAHPVADQYIVTLNDTTQSGIPGEAQQLAAKHGGTVFHVYQHALHGFAVRMTAAQAVAMSEEPTVASVQEDGVVHATTVEPPTPDDTPPTGIDRIDQHTLPLDDLYHYDATGLGVHAYIIDTGIEIGDSDFGGRASYGTDQCVDDSSGLRPVGTCNTEPAGTDCYGHGTHVAGILGGSEFGVAKDVSLVSVRVLDCDGEGEDSGVIAGVDWVTSHAISPAVANMSLGGGLSPDLDTAIRDSQAIRTTVADGHTSTGSAMVTASDGSFSAADVGVEIKDTDGSLPAGTTIASVQSTTQAMVSSLATTSTTSDVFTIGSGVSYAVAAGNSAESACDSSPSDLGGTHSATITAAASDPTNDTQAYFSNFGSCVDLFAPGMNITSDGTNTAGAPDQSMICDGVTCTLSGTSMATPHVAGTAALYLQTHASATPATVKSVITTVATPNAISNATSGTPNLLDYTGSSAPTLTVTPSTHAAQLSWMAPLQDVGSSISGYEIYRGTASGGETPLTSVSSSTTTYTDSGLTCGVTEFYEVAAVDVIGQTLSNERSTVPCGAGYFPVVPTRILDTRHGTGDVPVSPVGPGQTLTLHVLGAGSPPVIPTMHVTSVVLNVTATDETAPSFLTVFPSGESPPAASNLNMVADHDVPNLVTVEVGTGGDVSFYNNAGSTDVVADVVGYFDDGTQSGEATYNPQPPTRVLDTRNGTGGVPVSPLGPGEALTLNLTGTVPNNAVAVVLNVTATDETQASFLTVYPEDVPQPMASNLNLYPDTDIANLVVVKVSSSPADEVNFYNNTGSTDVVADLAGYYTQDGTGSLYVATSPSRVLDTRTSTGGHLGPLGQGQSLNLAVAGQAGVPSSGAEAVVMNVTATDATGASFLTVYPAGGTQPTASNVNFSAGEDVPNLSITELGSAPPGDLTIFNNAGSVDVVGDVSGYYVG